MSKQTYDKHLTEVAQAGIETSAFGIQLAQEISQKLEDQLNQQVNDWLAVCGTVFSKGERAAIRSNARYFFVKTLKQQWGL